MYEISCEDFQLELHSNAILLTQVKKEESNKPKIKGNPLCLPVRHVFLFFVFVNKSAVCIKVGTNDLTFRGRCYVGCILGACAPFVDAASCCCRNADFFKIKKNSTTRSPSLTLGTLGAAPASLSASVSIFLVSLVSQKKEHTHLPHPGLR